MVNNWKRAKRTDKTVHIGDDIEDNVGQARWRGSTRPSWASVTRSWCRYSGLTEIIKQEWESVWPTALNDLAAAAVKNQVLCENNLEIMLMLSEEIFEFAKNNLTKADTAVLQAKYTENLKVIYQLCEYVCKEYLKNSSQVSLSLMKIAMKTIQTLLTWAPLSYIFGTDLIQNILIPILSGHRFTTVSLQCLTEIYSFNVFKIDLQPQELEVIKGILLTR
jgi:hypothetical protein